MAKNGTNNTTATVLPAVDENDIAVKPLTPKSGWSKLWRYVVNNMLILLLIASMILGVVLGVLLRLRDKAYTKDEVSYLKFPGDLLLAMLKMTIIPLIMSSLVTGMCSMDARVSEKMGLRAVVYYLTTTLLAVILGIILVVTIKPGTKDQSKETSNRDDVSALATFLNLIRNLFPDNMVEMCFRKKVAKMMNNPATNETYSKVVTGEGTNMLGVVSVSIMIAACINHIGEKARALRKLFEAINQVSIILVTAFIWYSPIGVLFLVMSEVIKQEDPGTAFSKLAFYCLTVLLGLGLHGFITLPLTYYIIIRKNPFTFIQGMLPAMLTALATASSLATLPVTMRNLEINNKVDPRVIAFVAPVGANINMDGTALYEAVAVIFIGQNVGKEMDFVKVLTISVTATAAAIGAAGVPQAGLVTMVIVLTAVGFPIDGIGLILAVDWFLDRFRTSINVLGDAFGAAIVHTLSLKDLERMDLEDEQRAQKTALKARQNTRGDHLNSSTCTGTTKESSAQDTTVSSYCPPPPQPGSGSTVEQAESHEAHIKRIQSTAVDFHGNRGKGTPQGEENAVGGAVENPTPAAAAIAALSSN